MAFRRWVALLGLQGLLLPLPAQAPAWTPVAAWTGFPLVPAAQAEAAEGWPGPGSRIWTYHQWYCRTLEVLANLERLDFPCPGPALERPAPPHWQGRPGRRRPGQPGRDLVVEVQPIEGLDASHAHAGSFR